MIRRNVAGARHRKGESSKSLFCGAFLSVYVHSESGGHPMPISLTELEAERSKILRQFSSLGDLRSGSICAVPRRCGKPTCHCAKPNDPGHDPQIRLTRRVEGKTVAESFPSPSAWRKAQSEIEEYHRLQNLTAELITIN